MTREDVRILFQQITGQNCISDDNEAVYMTSLQQLEFAFAIEDSLDFQHQIPDDVGWKSVNDVVKWLEERGELKAATASKSIHS